MPPRAHSTPLARSNRRRRATHPVRLARAAHQEEVGLLRSQPASQVQVAQTAAAGRGTSALTPLPPLPAGGPSPSSSGLMSTSWSPLSQTSPLMTATWEMVPLRGGREARSAHQPHAAEQGGGSVGEFESAGQPGAVQSIVAREVVEGGGDQAWANNQDATAEGPALPIWGRVGARGQGHPQRGGAPPAGCGHAGLHLHRRQHLGVGS